MFLPSALFSWLTQLSSSSSWWMGRFRLITAVVSLPVGLFSGWKQSTAKVPECVPDIWAGAWRGSMLSPGTPTPRPGLLLMPYRQISRTKLSSIWSDKAGTHVHLLGLISLERGKKRPCTSAESVLLSLQFNCLYFSQRKQGGGEFTPWTLVQRAPRLNRLITPDSSVKTPGMHLVSRTRIYCDCF